MVAYDELMKVMGSNVKGVTMNSYLLHCGMVLLMRNNIYKDIVDNLSVISMNNGEMKLDKSKYSNDEIDALNCLIVNEIIRSKISQ